MFWLGSILSFSNVVGSYKETWDYCVIYRWPQKSDINKLSLNSKDSNSLTAQLYSTIESDTFLIRNCKDYCRAIKIEIKRSRMPFNSSLNFSTSSPRNRRYASDFLFSQKGWMMNNLRKLSKIRLQNLLYIFPKVLTRRTCLIIESFFTWWSFPLFSSP